MTATRAEVDSFGPLKSSSCISLHGPFDLSHGTR